MTTLPDPHGIRDIGEILEIELPRLTDGGTPRILHVEQSLPLGFLGTGRTKAGHPCA